MRKVIWCCMFRYDRIPRGDWCWWSGTVCGKRKFSIAAAEKSGFVWRALRRKGLAKCVKVQIVEADNEE